MKCRAYPHLARQRQCRCSANISWALRRRRERKGSHAKTRSPSVLRRWPDSRICLRGNLDSHTSSLVNVTIIHADDPVYSRRGLRASSGAINRSDDSAAKRQEGHKRQHLQTSRRQKQGSITTPAPSPSPSCSQERSEPKTDRAWLGF